MDLSGYRKEIDRIDAELLRLFAERTSVCEGIAEYKSDRGMPVLDPGREKEKLDRIASAAPAGFEDDARRLWEAIFRISRDRQERIIGEKKLRCGLLGEHLGHSYSPLIHSKLGAYPYLIYEKSPEEVADFIKNGEWDGLNVTIPYKKNAAAAADVLSDEAAATGSVNTLVRRDGKIYGYNTDVSGFAALVGLSGINVCGKKALVLGSGGASRAVCRALKDLGALPVVISRSGDDNYGNIPRHYSDAAVIVNATPVGMYPDNLRSPLDLSGFASLSAVFDLIYNPARTCLVMQAEEMGIPAFNGLYMLVAQAKASSEIFTGNALSARLVAEITERIGNMTENLILVGMPGCGKTTVGRILAERTGKEFIDADDELSKELGIPVPDYLSEHGEDAFRTVETRVLERIGKLSGKVIATGGGCVTRKENYPLLHQNGRIVFIERDPSELTDAGRPLSQKRGAAALWAEREPLYRCFADVTVQSRPTPDETADDIVKALFENL